MYRGWSSAYWSHTELSLFLSFEACCIYSPTTNWSSTFAWIPLIVLYTKRLLRYCWSFITNVSWAHPKFHNSIGHFDIFLTLKMLSWVYSRTNSRYYYSASSEQTCRYIISEKAQVWFIMMSYFASLPGPNETLVVLGHHLLFLLWQGKCPSYWISLLRLAIKK